MKKHIISNYAKKNSKKRDTNECVVLMDPTILTETIETSDPDWFYPESFDSRNENSETWLYL